MLQRIKRVPERVAIVDDPATILRFAIKSLDDGMAAALVTLTDVHGGASRGPGSQMVVREDGGYCGFVSGGCVEAAVAYEALDVLASGEDKVVRYGKGSPWFDIVLPCGGGITLSIHALRSAQPLREIVEYLEQRKSAGLVYDAQRCQLKSMAENLRPGWEGERFSAVYHPDVRLIIAGASIEAEITRQLALAAGYEMSDDRALMDRHSALILLWHDIDRELPFLQQARLRHPFYTGALGSKRTHQRRKEALRELGWSHAEIARIKAPVGLFPKARDARSLALSVLADVAAARQMQEQIQ